MSRGKHVHLSMFILTADHPHCVQDGAMALHVACQNGHLKTAETLITAHASVNAQNNKVSVHSGVDITC